MFLALNEYVIKHHLSYDEPNIRPYIQSRPIVPDMRTEKDSYESMVLEYLELFDSDDHIVNRNGNNFLIANYRTFTSYKLEVIDGRLKVLQEAKVLQDCIENAKSAYDVDPEIMNKIQDFEKKWYKKNDISINDDKILKEIHEEAKRACDGLDEYCETLEDSYVCREHILRILDIIENLTKDSEKKGEHLL